MREVKKGKKTVWLIWNMKTKKELTGQMKKDISKGEMTCTKPLWSEATKLQLTAHGLLYTNDPTCHLFL